MTSTAQTGERSGRIPAGHYRFAHAARMEWIKLRSLRSTMWAMLLFAAGIVSIGVVTMANTNAPTTAEAWQAFDPTNTVLVGLALGQLIIGVLGVLLMTGEYSSGAIRSTLTAIPNRPLMLTAKAAVFGVVTFAIGEIVVFVTFLAGRAALTDAVPTPALGDPGVLRALVLSGAYLAQIGLIGLGLGAVVRHTASAVGALVGVIFVLPLIAVGLTGVTVAKYFPTMIAGNSIAVAEPVSDMLPPWAGFGLLCLYTAVALGAGGWLLARRDA